MRIVIKSGIAQVMKRIMGVFVLLWMTGLQVAAQPGEVEMADKLREDGKIWVVVGVILIIFAGIILYLIRLDAKISKLEKQVKQG